MGTSATKLTEVSVFTAGVYPPAVGTPVQAQDIEVVAQALANRTRWLEDHRLQRLFQAGDDSVAGGAWTTTSYVGGLGGEDGFVDVEDCEVGDIIDVTMCTTVTMNGSSTSGGAVRLVGIDDALGTPNPAGQLLGAVLLVAPNPTATTFYMPIALTSTWTVVKAGTTRIAVQGKVFDGSDDLTPGPGYSIVARRYKGAVA